MGGTKELTNQARVLVRGGRPSQSRSWAPVDNTAPRGWYKIDVGPGKLHQEPGRPTIKHLSDEIMSVELMEYFLLIHL